VAWSWHALAREPLVHFAIAGGTIFLGSSVASRGPAGEKIVVTPETVQAMVRARQELLGRPVLDQERRDLVHAFVNNEILLREAYVRGIDKQDSVVHQRLLEVMRFVLGEEPPEPSAADLRSFLEAHRNLYEVPEALTFSQVFFPNGEEDTPQSRRSDALLQRLRGGADYSKLGARFWLGSKIEHYPEPDLARVLGARFVDTVSALPVHQWNGPFNSTQGLHFVRVDVKDPPQLPPLQALAPTLRTDWLNWKRAEILDRKIDDLRKNYRIEISGNYR